MEIIVFLSIVIAVLAVLTSIVLVRRVKKQIAEMTGPKRWVCSRIVMFAPFIPFERKNCRNTKLAYIFIILGSLWFSFFIFYFF